MAKFKVTWPDGSQHIVDAPDGARQEDVLAYAQQEYGKAMDAQYSHKESYTAKAVKPPGSAGDFLKGIAESANDFLRRGPNQRIAETGALGPGVAEKLYAEEQARRNARDYGGQDTEAAALGRLAGGVVPGTAAALASGGTGLVGSTLASALTGGVAELLRPTTSQREAMTNVAGGVGGSVTGNLVSHLLLPGTARNLTRSQKEIIDIADREGIPLRTGEATGSSAIQNFEQVAANRPVTASMEQKFNEEQSRAINRAVTSRFGKPIQEINPGDRLDIKTGVANEIKSYVQNKQVPLNTDFRNAVDNMELKYSVGGPLTMTPEMSTAIKDARKLISQYGNTTLPGETIQDLRSILLNKMRDVATSDKAGKSDAADLYRNFADGLKDALGSTMTQQEKAGWQAANRKYSNYKVYEEALTPGRTEALGDVPINRLAGAMENSRPNSYFEGKGDMAGLARLGQVIRPPTRNAMLGNPLSDLYRIPLYPVLESEAAKAYLTGNLPLLKQIRDLPQGPQLMDSLFRAAGITTADQLGLGDR